MFLGRLVHSHYGLASKASAMHVCCAERVVPRFSRMSGIQQWRNAVALFVNIGGADYR